MGINIGTTGVDEIYVGEGTTDYSAMQGPCPSGFHVPGQPEFASLYNTFTSLGLSNFANYMKIPLAGYMQSNTSISDSGTSARIATCTPREDNEKRLLYVYITSGSVGTNYNLYKGYYAYSIRPFKDEPVIPDSNWTTIYSGSGGAGIFWDQTNGLISISSDGTSWKTISDKNLGATTVYNSGNTLSESNAGKYYQRGNNYGFPGIGSSTPISTSSTKVDTTGYGPGNYYSSSTYITSGHDWSDPSNNNLRGRDTGTTKKGNVTEVYVGTTKVRPDGGETYIIDLTESYSNTIPAGDTINKVKILLDIIAAPSAFISIGSGNNGLSIVGNGIGLPGGVWVTIPTSDLSGTIEYDFNTSIVSFDLTSGGNHQSGSQQFSYWTIDESIDELISYTISQWGDPSFGTVKISIERDTNNSSTNQ